eukprot:TRINITY_DN12792_c0_g1_i1.p1 TRINITY_DN12792_c0_g1~~TRINITY_DN12792_c0_g1_i1.p1  ORF type:complete len:432 (-),score=93.37 TRINITY_DN12792_c0_g1_i1:99-1394(-)
MDNWQCAESLLRRLLNEGRVEPLAEFIATLTAEQGSQAKADIDDILGNICILLRRHAASNQEDTTIPGLLSAVAALRSELSQHGSQTTVVESSTSKTIGSTVVETQTQKTSVSRIDPGESGTPRSPALPRLQPSSHGPSEEATNVTQLPSFDQDSSSSIPITVAFEPPQVGGSTAAMQAQQLRRCEMERSRLGDELQASQRLVDRLSAEKTKMQDQIRRLTEQNRRFGDSETDLQREVQRLQQRVDTALEEAAQSRASAHDREAVVEQLYLSEEAVRRLEQEKARLQTELHAARLETKAAEARAADTQAQASQVGAGHAQELFGLQQERDALALRVTQCQTEHAGCAEARDQLVTEISALQRKLQAATVWQEEITQLREEMDNREKLSEEEIKRLQGELETSALETKELELVLQAAQDGLSGLKKKLFKLF